MKATPRGLARDGDRVYQLRISLDGIEPAIWRRVLVSASASLRRLHGVIQKSMGWTNSHLHMFEIDGRQLGRPDPDGELYLEDDARWKLREFLVAPGDKLAYEYDFGDSWRHTILLEEVLEAAEAAGSTARCIAGSRACPPEDCGGIPGYQAFLEAILDPFHPDHREMREWAGGGFDPEAFDVGEANRRVSRTR
jgi:hypothetical protein